MSRIAIIGAGGFVGTTLIESLLAEGRNDVSAVIRSYRSMAGYCRFGAKVDTRLADAEDAEQLASALQGVSTAVNLTTGIPAGIERSTAAIHEACIRAGVRRLIHLSSAVVYGTVPIPVSDDAPPLDKHWMPYAIAKGRSENWLRERINGGVEVVVLRPGIVWGVRSPHTLGFAKALANKSSYLVDGGQHIFNGVYIGNLTAAIRAACDFSGSTSGFYNVGDAETITWREFFEALGAPLGCDPARLPLVSGEKFPWSVGAAVDAVQSFPPVNALYHRLKVHIPDGLKAAIRARLEGSCSYDRHAREYTTMPGVDRELWNLQRVRHKLPIAKFGQKFSYVPPVSFPEAVRRTVSWLRTLGMTVEEQTSETREMKRA